MNVLTKIRLGCAGLIAAILTILGFVVTKPAEKSSCELLKEDLATLVAQGHEGAIRMSGDINLVCE